MSSPKKPWNGTVDALTFGAACPSHTQSDRPVDENCLSLNIYAPPVITPGKLVPILFWVYGGSYLTGSGSEPRYNGSYDVSLLREFVVVVANYRLGVFGFLGGEQLRSRSLDQSSGNYGLADQRLAMKFVQQHARAFGGDPDRVLVIGEYHGWRRRVFTRTFFCR
jgi:carboxylesterase type B